jgi:hypothetical protein
MSPVFLCRTKTKIATFGNQSAVYSPQSAVDRAPMKTEDC